MAQAHAHGRAWLVPFLVVCSVATACTKRNPRVCCETDAECAAVGYDSPEICEIGACVGNVCTEDGCDGNEDCPMPAPHCVAGACQSEPPPEPTCVDHGGRILWTSSRDGDEDVWTAFADGTSANAITKTATYERSSVWSPDGTKIAYTNDNGVQRNLFVMSADGSGSVPLTNDAAQEDHLEWARDGGFVAFDTSENRAVVIGTDGTGAHELSGPAGSSRSAPSWAPDGSKLVYIISPMVTVAQVYAVGVDGVSGQAILSSIPSAVCVTPRYAPDGRKVVFGCNTNAGDLYLVNADSSGLFQLTATTEKDLDPRWSPDGTRIAFVRETAAGATDIWVINPDRTGLRNVTAHAGNDDNVRWSPDGNSLIFDTDRDGNREIYRVNVDGSAPTNLSNDPGPDTRPDWASCP